MRNLYLLLALVLVCTFTAGLIGCVVEDRAGGPDDSKRSGFSASPGLKITRESKTVEKDLND